MKPSGGVAAYRASTPQVWSLNPVWGKINSAFHPIKNRLNSKTSSTACVSVPSSAFEISNWFIIKDFIVTHDIRKIHTLDLSFITDEYSDEPRNQHWRD
ncbi:hypothetical protein TNCV_4095801 [Trichonephila clavipes]|uniref:Uncharacterized protein n=1 Tax=Trichonephila clavipes TaxID=2585209 RepID=A0A8X6SAL4_TRICX|nr:hypothetical protein TNCV_4095801 [Trichonephila clavipes]